ncbi:MAG: hypothetical protein ACI4QE_01385, partial [Acutalibacteraceae bacterium]
MKRNLKFISLLLSVMMVFSMVAGVSVAAEGVEDTTNEVYIVDKAGWIFGDGAKLFVVNGMTDEVLETTKQEGDSPKYAVCQIPSTWTDITICRVGWDVTLETFADSAKYNTWSGIEYNPAYNGIFIGGDTDVYCDNYDPNEEIPQMPATIYFDNSVTQWETVYVYGWGASNLGNKAYAMTRIGESDIWTFTFSAPIDEGLAVFLFKDDETKWDNQSGNVMAVGGMDLYTPDSAQKNFTGTWSVYTGETLPSDSTETSESTSSDPVETHPATDINVDLNGAFKGADSINIYYLDSKGVNPAPSWPGKPLPMNDDGAYYSYTVPEGYDTVIFVGRYTSMGEKESQVQTANISVDTVASEAVYKLPVTTLYIPKAYQSLTTNYIYFWGSASNVVWPGFNITGEATYVIPADVYTTVKFSDGTDDPTHQSDEISVEVLAKDPSESSSNIESSESSETDPQESSETDPQESTSTDPIESDPIVTEPATKAPVTSVKLSASSVKMTKSTKTVEAVVKVTSMSPSANDGKIKWFSSKKSVFMVKNTSPDTKTVRITTVKGSEGSAYLIAKNSKNKEIKRIKVTVVQRVTAVKLNYAKKTIKKGDYYQLKATASPSNASVKT